MWTYKPALTGRLIKFDVDRGGKAWYSNIRAQAQTTKQSIRSHLATSRFASVHSLIPVTWKMDFGGHL